MQSSNAAPGSTAVYPLLGSRTASTKTEISWRGISKDHLGAITVTGSASGAHSGIIMAHADGLGASFVPDAPFRADEKVTVEAEPPVGPSGENSFTFTVARTVSPAEISTGAQAETFEGETFTFRTRPDLKPPRVDITEARSGTTPGFIFVDPRSPVVQTGPMILDNSGELIWFHPMGGADKQMLDFRVQEYLGEPVLTWWEGVSALGQGLGHFVICDSSYTEIATLRVGNGYFGADLHEFKITPQGTALICVYNRVRWDMTAVGGVEDDLVVDGIVQELEIPSSRVLFEWHSLDHIDLDESYTEVPEGEHEDFDYFHINSIDRDADGNLIVSARNTWTVYKIDRWTGEILWRVGGKKSTFNRGSGARTAYQHDARIHEDGSLSIFDNGDSGREGAASRGIVLELNADEKTATLAKEFAHPNNILSVFGGKMQLQSNGNAFIGYASTPAFAEFDPNGDVLFSGQLPAPIVTYRSYRFPWRGEPSDPPAIAVEKESDEEITVYASWNGATEVATWRVLAGDSPDQLNDVGSAPRGGFETAIRVQGSFAVVTAQAETKDGNVLGKSEPASTSDS